MMKLCHILMALLVVLGITEGESLAQVAMAPKQLLVLKPGIDRIHGTWIAAVMNKGQNPATYRLPVLLPREARDFQPVEGVNPDEMKLDETGLWVEKVFSPGVNVVSFAFVAYGNYGAGVLNLKPLADVGELSIMTPRGMLDVSGRDFVSSGTDVQDMERYSILTSSHMILAGEDLSLRVDGLPEGRSRLWFIGGVFSMVMLGAAGILTWKSRARSQPVVV